MNSSVIRKTVGRGVQDGHLGYASDPKPSLGTDSKFEVVPTKVRFKSVIAEGEIDLESGFLMLPQVIPQATPVGGAELVIVGPGGESTRPRTGGATLPLGTISPVGPMPP